MADTLLGSEPVADPNAAPAANPVATPAADPAAEPSKDAPTSGDAPKADPAPADGGEPEPKADAPKAPAEYAAFTAPEGVTLQPEYIAQATEVAKALNLPQEAAQKLVDFGIQQAQGMIKANEDALAAETSKWADQARADTEFGGDKLTENLTLAKKSVETFASPALKELLEGSGLGDHPEVIRLFVKIGKAISEDTLVTGNPDGKPRSRNAADVLYGSPKAA